MSIALPNLDDRTFADLVEEARGLLVTHAPDLTNHNPSDPLITFIELFAYFIEIQLFRVNLVTDKSRLVFLRLLNGPDPQPDPNSDPKRRPTRAEIDAEVRRTVLALRRVERAVTPADFEFLALTADSRVARARCHPNVNLEITDPVLRAQRRPGHVSVVIVPAPNASAVDLTKIVADYLEPRRLLGTRVHVVGPTRVKLTVQLTLHLLPGAVADTTRDRAAATLKDWFDPFVGRKGDGWPLGRDVYVSEIYRLLDGLEGVDFVTRTVGADGHTLLDELVASWAPDERFERNAEHELISFALLPDELVDITVDIQTELPTA